jgi:hypothetical protein
MRAALVVAWLARHPILIVCLLLTIPQPGRAWGPEGHAIIAEIAQRYLTPQARARIGDLIGPGVSLASISSWADDIRQDRPQTYNWHFVNIPLDALSYSAARDCRPDPERGDCIIAAVARLRAQLTNPHATAQAKREALKYLVHLIADLHQPLYTIREKRGGNDLAVRFFAGPRSASAPKEVTNLHARLGSRADSPLCPELERLCRPSRKRLAARPGHRRAIAGHRDRVGGGDASGRKRGYG